MLVIITSIRAQKIEISGTLLDSITKLNLPYGNIIIKNNKDSIITGTITNEKGEFKIKNINYQKGMYLVASYVGYYNKIIDITVDKNFKFNADSIYINQNINQINTVTIIGTIKNVEQKFDRKVFNINENKATASHTILDLLRTLPGVAVSEDGSVRFKGAPATIYVDDQQYNYIYPKLEMIPVANVNKIELIDGSSRGGGSGIGGIINIKMKKIVSDGLSGMLSTGLNSIEFKKIDQFNGFTNVNYKYKKFIVFNNFNNDYQYNNNNKLTDGIFNYNNNVFITNSKSNNNYTEKTFNDIFGVIIFPNTKTKIIISNSYFNDKQEYNTNSKQQQSYSLTNKIFDEYSVNNKGFYKNPYKGLHIHFKHEFDTIGKEIIANITIQNSRYNQDDFTSYQYSYLSSLSTDSLFQVLNKIRNINNSMFYDFYFNKPINLKTRWNVSYEGYYNLKNLEDEKYKLNNVDYLPFNKISNYNTSYNQLSFHLGTVFRKWKFDGGLSLQYYKLIMEYTRYKENNQDTLLKINKDFLSFLPLATISYSLDSMQDLKLTFARTSQVPFNLCDFIDKQNPRNWTSGNSKLKSVNFNNLYFGYSLNKETWNVSAEAFYSLTNNEIYDVQYPYSAVVILTMPENIAKKSSLGIDLSSWISLKNKYDFNFSSSIYHSSIDASTLIEKINEMGLNENNLTSKDFGYNIKFSTDIKFNLKTSGMFYVNYYSREITFEGYKYGYFNSSINITRKFFNNKLLLTIGINNLLDDIVKHGEYSNYLEIKKTTTEISNTFKRTYFITLLYKFRQGDRDTKDIK